MLVSKDEFIRQQQEKKTFIATVTKQDKYGIIVEGIGVPKDFYLYYGSYHILEFFN